MVFLKLSFFMFLPYTEQFENHLTYSINSGLRDQRDRIHMPWDNSVNKNAVLFAARTTLGVGNMPLTG